MLEHLVEGHLGSYYISSSEPEFIEEYCEICGDSDTILTSWDDSEKDARVNALLRYFMIKNLNSREDIDKKVDEYISYDVEKKDIIPSLLNYIDCINEETYNFATYLFESKNINEDEYKRIINISRLEDDRQIKMVKYFSKSMFTKDSNGNVKVLKLAKK